MNNYKFIESRARNRAIDTRNELGINLSEPIDADILKVLRKKEKISIIITELKGSISGFFLRKGDICLIVINSARSFGHQRFTAAHEYYHFKYDKGMNSRICPINKYNDVYENEMEANYFASHFLMPDESLKYYVDKRIKGKKLNIRDLIYLENYFMVSHALMLVRLKLIKIISEKEKELMKNGIIYKANKLGYNTALYKDTKEKGTVIYSDYAELAEELLEKGSISYGKYEELLIDGNFEDILFEEKGNENEEEIGFETTDHI
jgi:Zn-dependent peptidase ImmA (M78 family)